VGAIDKDTIEERFGPLWSGKPEASCGGRIRTISDVKRAFDLVADDVVAIDLVELPDGKCAFRFYDGEDRRVVVFVFDAEGEILEEHRAHIAEWLGDLYHESGALAFDAEAMIHILQKKQAEGTP
jgi:Fe2+ or Zn2+ uptake regulation protein